MEENKIMFNGYEITGNPFDVMMEAAVGYFRNMLFVVNRMRNPAIPINYGDNEYSNGDYLVKRIHTQIDIINSMTEEQVELCRNNSVLMKKCGNFMPVNEFLFKLERSFRTRYNECNPEFDPEIEALFFGEESSEYLRRVALADTVNDIYKKTYSFDEIDSLLNAATDILDPNVKNREYSLISKEDYDKAEKFLSDYDLTMWDLDFMKSVVIHKKDSVEHKTSKLFDKIKDGV